ncbi:MAG TPA: PKD domain-containing protein [Gemmatimonadales bacterium]|nr:PKD domain-containing protein [Gemmatimonadales bacterium]
MTSTSLWLRSGIMTLILVLAACSSADEPLAPGLAPPSSIVATALGLSSIRVDWVPDGGAQGELQNFLIQRRVDLEGKFEDLTLVGPTTTVYFDTGLKPATFYGYRIIAMSRSGEHSDASVVAGAQTAPLPGLRYETSLTGGTDVSVADPNGYQLTIEGPTRRDLAIGTLDQGTISPLKAGDYRVTLSDILPTCTIQGDTVRQVTVVDTGLTTQAIVSFTAVCIDPSRGNVVTRVIVQGDSVDADGYQVEYAGIITGDTVPALGGSVLAGLGGEHAFNALYPGDYEITIADVDQPCVASSATTADVQVQPLSNDTVTFRITCPNKGGGNPSAPLVLQNLFTPQTAATGQTVTLDVVLDLTGKPGQDIGVVQAELLYDPAVLSYQSATSPSPGQMGGLTVNSNTPGDLVWLNFSTATPPPTGVVPAARFTFQVTDASGATAITHSLIQLTSDFSGTVSLDTLFRIVEDTFTIGSGGGGGNQSPTAEAGGPYSGTAGSPISFQSTGSTDPDGTITGYSWNFGDGQTSTQADPTHSYSAAGSYTATLTVTDNQSATGTDQAPVTVTGGGGGNQSPVANANGPYTGTVGTAVTFNSSGSSDPDGTIASYAWDFGDGNSGTGASPSHSYTAAGTYTAQLTVTDNGGAAASSQAAVTISSSGGSTPFTWTASFGAFEAVTQTVPLTITLDLSTDISQTPGPEALQTWAVDSLKWDPAVLEYFSFNYGPGGGGSVNPTDAVGGCKCKLVFGGTQPGSNNSGLITIATIRFKFVGATGANSTTSTKLGPLLSTPATGSFNYTSLTRVQEASVTVP